MSTRRPPMNCLFGHGLSTPVWKCSYLSLHTNVHLYRALVIYVLSRAEMRTLLSSDLSKLDTFHRKCQRQLLNTHWWDCIANVSLHYMTGPPSIGDLTRHRLPLFSHIVQLSSGIPTNDALHIAVNLHEGKRPDAISTPLPGRKNHINEDAGVPLSTLWSTKVGKGDGVTRQVFHQAMMMITRHENINCEKLKMWTSDRTAMDKTRVAKACVYNRRQP